MKIYAMKQDPIEVVQWNGDNFKVFERWLGDVAEVDIYGTRDRSILIIGDPMTKEDYLMAHMRDYVLRYRDGTIEIIDKRSFESQYEELAFA